MKKITIMFLCIALALVFTAGYSQAVDLGGKKAIGFNGNLLGGRYWIDNLIGIDGGIGFSTGGGSTAFSLGAGLPYVIKSTKNLNFELKPSIMFGITSPTAPATSVTAFEISALGVVEYFIPGLEEISFNAGVGLNLNINSAATTTTVFSITSSVPFFGLYYYF